MSESAEPIRVTNLQPRLWPHLSDEAKRALAPERHGSLSDDLLVLVRRFAAPATDEQLREFGMHLSGFVESLRRAPERFAWVNKLWATRSPVDGLLACPMAIPLVDGGEAAMMFVKIVGSADTEYRAYLKTHARHAFRLDLVEQGVLPERPYDAPPSWQPPQEVDVMAEIARARSR